jgi:peptidoglycan/LPS O-acetylase OafA/YrhL
VPVRLPLIDALKALASQLIVLHHLAIYGPMSDAVRPWAGPLVDALADWGRLAVQPFLVIAGYLAARSLAPGGVPRVAGPMSLVARRWVRLAGPYLAALSVALLTAAIGRALTRHETVPAVPTLPQVLANAAMLQDWLGHEALSAGVWYVSIDLQLYALLVGLLWLGARSGRRAAAPALVLALGAASLFFFNRDPHWDSAGPYFFGSYALGALAAWAGPGRHGRLALAAIALLGLAALVVEPRIRIAVALATALLLAVGLPRGWGAHRLDRPVVGALGRISYSVFLIHYPVCVLFEAAAARWFPTSPLPAAAGLLLAWAASNVAGALLYRSVEAPLTAALAKRRGARPAQSPSIA